MKKYDLSPLIGFALFILLMLLLGLGQSDRWYVMGFNILVNIPLALVMFGCAGTLYLGSFALYSSEGNIPFHVYRLHWLQEIIFPIACPFKSSRQFSE